MCQAGVSPPGPSSCRAVAVGRFAPCHCLVFVAPAARRPSVTGRSSRRGQTPARTPDASRPTVATACRSLRTISPAKPPNARYCKIKSEFSRPCSHLVPERRSLRFAPHFSSRGVRFAIFARKNPDPAAITAFSRCDNAVFASSNDSFQHAIR